MIELLVSKKAKRLGYDLFPFQRDATEWLVSSPNVRNYLGDEMGLGKTIVAFTYANSIQAESVLYTCPASLRLNVAREASIWFALSKHPPKAILSAKDFYKVKQDSLIHRGYRPTPFIVSYNMLVSCEPLRKYCLSRQWDLVISDEIDEVRNLEAQSTQIMGQIWNNTADILFMSGTPMPQSAADVYPAISKMAETAKHYMSEADYDLCTDFHQYTEHFTYIRNTPYGKRYTGVRNRDDFKRIFKKTGKFFLRRTMDKVYPDMPPLICKPVYLDFKVETSLDDDERVESMLSKYENDDIDDERLEKSPVMAQLNRELGLALANCDETYEYVEKLIANGKFPLIFAWHREVINTIARRLKHHNPLIMHGGLTPKQKQAAVDAFENGESDILIGNIHTMGKGWTLNRSADSVWYETDWLASKVRQGCGRSRRIGQRAAKVMAHFFITKNDFHQRKIATMIRKQRNEEKIFEDE